MNTKPWCRLTICLLPACLPDCQMSVCLSVWPGCLIPAWVRLFIRTDNNNNCQLQSAAVVARHSAVQRDAPRDMLRFFHIQFQMKFSCCQHQNPVPNPSQNPVTGLRISPPLPLSLFPCGVNFAFALSKFVFHFWPRQNLLHTFDASPQGAGYS